MPVQSARRHTVPALVALLFAAALSMLSAPTAYALPPAPKQEPVAYHVHTSDVFVKAALVAYHVHTNDTLYDIADRYMVSPNDWAMLQQLNNVSDPHDLQPYVNVLIPIPRLKQTRLKAQVVAVRGLVELAARSGPFSSLVVGKTLTEGDRVRTGDDASVALELPDGSHLVLPSSSMILIQRLRRTVLTRAVERQFELLQGSVDTDVTPMKNSRDTFSVFSPSAVAGVRGTQFRVHDVAGGVTAVEVIDGKVAVAGRPHGSTSDTGGALVPAGYGNLTSAGRRAGAPIKLLAAPTLVQPGKVQNTSNASFDLLPVTGAQAYHAQIATDAGFLEVVRDSRGTTPHFSFDKLPEGLYFVRISAIDANGLEGLPRVYTFERRDNTLSASSGPRAGSPGYEFRWFVSRAGVATHYRFLLAATPDFAAPLLDLPDVAGGHLSIAGLAPGDYYWRVIAEQFENGRLYTEESNPQSFTLGR